MEEQVREVLGAGPIRSAHNHSHSAEDNFIMCSTQLRQDLEYNPSVSREERRMDLGGSLVVFATPPRKVKMYLEPSNQSFQHRRDLA